MARVGHWRRPRGGTPLLVMVRIVLISWVLLSVPLCIGIGLLYRSSSKSTSTSYRRDDGWDPSQVAAMLKRNGFHHPRAH